MKILGVLISHDKKIEVLEKVLNCSKKIKELDVLEIFCFDTEIETIKFAKENNIQARVFKRPDIDMDKITVSYIGKMSGMWEGELMHVAWLRNRTIDRAIGGNFDYLFTIDADILFEPDTVEKLLKLDSDIATGWYFNKRAPYPSVSGVGIELNLEKIEEKIKNREIIEVATGGMGGVLIKKSVFKFNFDLYNGKFVEDTKYYNKIRKEGFVIKCDSSLYYKHIGDGFKKIAKDYMERKEIEWNLKT